MKIWRYTGSDLNKWMEVFRAVLKMSGINQSEKQRVKWKSYMTDNNDSDKHPDESF